MSRQGSQKPEKHDHCQASIIVSIMLATPYMILGETALSFPGLGMQPPAVSWGVLLMGAQNVVAIPQQLWLLRPCVFVVIRLLSVLFRPVNRTICIVKECSDIPPNCGSWKWLFFLVVTLQPLVDDLAQITKHLNLVIAVTTGTFDSGAIADVGLVFFRPFDNLDVLCALGQCSRLLDLCSHFLLLIGPCVISESSQK